MRTRIAIACLSTSILFCVSTGALAGATVKTEHVWVVFKTHFDIGYTDRVAAVLARYRGPMVDNAMAVIAKNRTSPSGQRFSWTVPGWPLARIIDDQQTPDRRAKVVAALKEGSLAVHALPFSMHTESLDIEDLVRGLHFSSQIARDLGKPLPIAAKMTDVPSHSWILPTLLHHAGIRFLHLGCNGGSQYPRIPRLFWWEGPDGSRILCAYTRDYGSPPTPEGDWPAKNYLAMIMEGDNHGPPTVEEVENVRRAIAVALPAAKVTFGTLGRLRQGHRGGEAGPAGRSRRHARHLDPRPDVQSDRKRDRPQHPPAGTGVGDARHANFAPGARGPLRQAGPGRGL